MNTQLPFCLPADITPAVFLAQYWQQKPLLIKNGLPSLANLLEPEDVQELALADEVTARLITQDNADPNQWQIQFSPFADDDITNTAKHCQRWTLLVQNLEQWSLEIAALWQHFRFVPQWQQDDIMVSYAPAGGSVGMHYDEYDVFLAQGYGSRRWQLGKFCNEDTPILPNQPLRLLDDMGDIIFDEVLEAGDVLYVPPRLAHYGVAQDDCLTFSFGFRRPSPVQLLDFLVDEYSQQADFKLPMAEPAKYIDHNTEHTDVSTAEAGTGVATHGSIANSTIDYMKQQLVEQLHTATGHDVFVNAVAKCLSSRRFDLIQEDEPMQPDDLAAQLNAGAVIIKEPAVKLLYTANPSKITCQGDIIKDVPEAAQRLLIRLADGETLQPEEVQVVEINTLCDWVNNGWITLL